MSIKIQLSQQKNSKIILGIDPGTLVMGFGIIAIQGNKIQLVEMNVLKLQSKKDHYERLQIIHKKVEDLIIQHQPGQFVIEAPFFGKNVQSMLKLGRAQGVAIAAAMSAGLPVTEYSPRKVKQSITGNGNADKDQVWKMLQRLLDLEAKPQYYDATDALAVAVCHYFQQNTVVSAMDKKVKGWEAFINANPQRITKK